MNPKSSIPYAGLDPNLILNAIESLNYRCSGTLDSLNSYENRVYQVGIEASAPFIAKFYRPLRWSDAAILEEHQFALELTEYEIPVVAPLVLNNQQTLHHYQRFRFALFPRWGGRALELDSFEQLEWMGRFIGRLHAVSSCRSFQHRPTLNIQTMGYDSFHFLIQHDFIPSHLKENYCQTVETVLQKIEQHFQQAGSLKQIRLHGDMHAGNVLWRDEGPHIVDLDDCIMGPAIQDIWMLLSGDKQEMNLQLDYILSGYQQFYNFNHRELILIEALRTLRMLYYSSWLAHRWQDPAFHINFPWFNTPSYWQEQLRDLQEQNYLLDEVLTMNNSWI